MGILTSQNHEHAEKPVILPLYGHHMQGHRSRWRYWAYSQQGTAWKIPVTYERRDCTQGDVGCDEIFDEDLVAVPSYPDIIFKTTLYKSYLNL